MTLVELRTSREDPDLMFTGPRSWREIVKAWHSMGDLTTEQAVAKLYNAGFRGKDLDLKR